MKKLKLIPREKYVSFAKSRFHDEGTLEIDDRAMISRSHGDPGAYVQAWIWVSDDDAKEVKNEK